MSKLLIRGEKQNKFMITIIQSKNESMAKLFFELNVAGEVDFIREGQDFSKILVNQNPLFAAKKKKIFCFLNMLDKKFAKELTALEKSALENKLFFLQFGKAKIFLPQWAKKQIKIYDLDKLSSNFSFWQKIASKVGVVIDYDEWQKANLILGSRNHFMFSILGQKKLAPKYSLDFFVINWSEGNIFKLLEAIDQKNSLETLRILQLFWQRDEDPVLVWNIIVRHFIQLKQIKDEVKISIHPYAASQLKKVLVNYKRTEIEQILINLLKLDVKAKTGYLEGKQKGRELIYFLLFSLLFSPSPVWQPEFWQPETLI